MERTNSVQTGSTMPTTLGEMSNLRFALFLSLPIICFLVTIVMYPLGYAVWLSFNSVQFIFGEMRVEFVGWGNYQAVLRAKDFWHSTKVSIIFTVLSVGLCLTVGLGLALVMSIRTRLQPLLRTLIILPWAISLYATGVTWYYLARGQTGIGTTIATWFGGEDAVSFIDQKHVILTLALGNAWNLAPLVAFFLFANISTISPNLYHLAMIDRLNVINRFFTVTLPPLRFSLFVFTCIVTVLSLKMFDYVYVLSRGGPGDTSSVLPFLLYDISFQQLNLGYGAAMSMYLLLLIIASTLLLYFCWGRKEQL